jgi:hypothetical protein
VGRAVSTAYSRRAASVNTISSLMVLPIHPVWIAVGVAVDPVSQRNARGAGGRADRTGLRLFWEGGSGPPSIRSRRSGATPSMSPGRNSTCSVVLSRLLSPLLLGAMSGCAALLEFLKASILRPLPNFVAGPTDRSVLLAVNVFLDDRVVVGQWAIVRIFDFEVVRRWQRAVLCCRWDLISDQVLRRWGQQF